MKTFFPFFLLILLAGCEQAETVENQRLAVVSGYLLPGQEISVRVSLEELTGSTDTVFEYLDSLHIWVSNGQNTELMTFGADGQYRSSMKAMRTQTYRIAFLYNGDTVFASTTVPARADSFRLSGTELLVAPALPAPGAADSNSLTVSWAFKQNKFYLLQMNTLEANPLPVRQTNSGDSTSKWLIENPRAVNQYTLSTKEASYFGEHAMVLYTMQDGYAGLYNLESTSSLNIESAYSNVTNGLGVFEALGADTLYFTIKRK